jgi:hypothetical protein
VATEVECASIVYTSPSDAYGFAQALLPAADAEAPLVWQPMIQNTR